MGIGINTFNRLRYIVQGTGLYFVMKNEDDESVTHIDLST